MVFLASVETYISLVCGSSKIEKCVVDYVLYILGWVYLKLSLIYTMSRACDQTKDHSVK